MNHYLARKQLHVGQVSAKTSRRGGFLRGLRDPS